MHDIMKLFRNVSLLF